MKSIAFFIFLLLFTFNVDGQRNMQVTVYDDGKACPGNCDSHVVFASRHNGTLNAYKPTSSRRRPQKCQRGEKCRICFSGSSSDCIDVTYRGGGPPKNRFDFTITFFAENCQRRDLPNKLRAKCRRLKRNVETLKTRINCFADPEHSQCKTLMEKAYERKRKDEILYNECKKLGQEAFNRKYQNQPTLKRDLECAYSANRRFLPDGTRYRPLLDGACRGKDLVGKYGLDCCSEKLFKSAMDITECSVYFPKPMVSLLSEDDYSNNLHFVF